MKVLVVLCWYLLRNCLAPLDLILFKADLWFAMNFFVMNFFGLQIYRLCEEIQICVIILLRCFGYFLQSSEYAVIE